MTLFSAVPILPQLCRDFITNLSIYQLLEITRQDKGFGLEARLLGSTFGVTIVLLHGLGLAIPLTR